MKKLFLAAGVAALAIAAPVSAQRGEGGNKGNKGQSAKVERGGGNAERGNRGQQARAERPQRASEGRGQRAEKAERRGGGEARGQRPARAERQARSENRGNQARDERRAEQRANRDNQARAERRAEQRANRGQPRNEQRLARSQERNEQRALRSQGRNDQRIARIDRDRDDRRIVLNDREIYEDRFGRLFADRGLPPGFVGGCPPGLAKKTPACVPPGQVKNLVGSRLPQAYDSHVLPAGLRDYYRDSDDYYWRYGNGYVYQVDREDQLIQSILPLIGAGLGIGMPFPYAAQNQNYYVPSSYTPFYPDTPYSYHRYADGYVYEIDRDRGMIIDMIPMLGQGYGVGQMMPVSYSYYNVPDPYRQWYQDDDDYFYRYAPGAIYQVDRESQLITAIASLLTGNTGLAVGQPLPMSYSAYNVPLSYRDQYYDTADNWYRYNDGYIYQVDPTTRLITAIISAIV